MKLLIAIFSSCLALFAAAVSVSAANATVPARTQSTIATQSDSSWPIVAQNGKQVSTLIYNANGQTATACYAPAGVKIVIEELFTTGQTEQRVVPQFGCAVATPFAGTGNVVAVRASVDGYDNPWHYVA